MAWAEKFTCDVCGKEKGSVNHWYLYSATRMESIPDHFEAFRWDEVNAKGFSSACGQECVIKAVNEWMQKIGNGGK